MEMRAQSTNNIEKLSSAFTNFMLRTYKGRTQPPVWPFSVMEACWYLNKFFHRELLNAIKKLKRVGVDDNKIAELFLAPGRISQILGQILYVPSQFSELKVEEARTLIENLLKYLVYFRKDDIFCEGGKNIIWGKDRVSEAVEETRMVDSNGEISKVLGKINGLLWLYCEMIHGAFHGCGYEFHGPYQLSGGETLIVRNYYDLKPPREIWPFGSKLSFGKLMTYEVYKGTEIGFDFMGHPSSSTSLPRYLHRLSAKCNGRQLKVSELKDISNNCEVVSLEGSEVMSELTKKELVKKTVQMHHYYLKPHKKVLKEQWSVPEEMLLSIEEKQVDKEYIESVEKLRVVRDMPNQESFKVLNNFFLSSVEP